MADTDEPKGMGAGGNGWPRRPGLAWGKLLPLVVLAAVAAAILVTGSHELVSMRVIAESRDGLQAFVRDHTWEAMCLFMLVYVVIVATGMPLGAVLTVLAGFLFGQLTASAMVVLSATVGATILFVAARTALGEWLAARSGRILEKMRQGFQDNALSYMLFLRLVPAFPLAFVNIVPALLGVPLRTYLIGTFFGIIPGTLAYAFVGGGLDSILAGAQKDPAFLACLAKEAAGEAAPGSCRLALDPADLVTSEVVIAFMLLGLVALLPAIWRMLRGKKAQ